MFVAFLSVIGKRNTRRTKVGMYEITVKANVRRAEKPALIASALESGRDNVNALQSPVALLH